MKLIKSGLINRRGVNSNSTRKLPLPKSILFIAICLFFCEAYSQTERTNMAKKTVTVNPANSFADLIVTCPDNGTQLPKIFLCGSGASRTITTNISGATVSWARLNETTCPVVATSDCPNTLSSCAWNALATGSSYTVNTAGQYRIRVSSGSIVETFYFNVYTNPVDIPITKKDIVCDTPGKITVSQLTGYEYSLDGGVYQSSNVFNITTAKTYTVRVRRQGTTPTGCVFTISDIVIAKKTLSVIPEEIRPKCNSENVSTGNSSLAKGGIKLTAFNANGQYYYKILQNGSLVNQVGPTSASDYTFTGLNPGTYTYEVKTDDCSTPQTGTAIIYPQTLLDNDPAVTKITTTAPGKIQLNPSGGTLPYTYYLGTTLVTGTSIPITVAGNYLVNVVDSQGCNYRTSVNVDKQSEPVFTISESPIKCNGDKGQIEFKVTNTNGNVVSFSINNGDTYTNNPVFSNLAAGTYKTVLRYIDGTLVSTSSKEIIFTQPDSALSAVAGVSELSGCGPTPNTNFGKIQINNSQGGIPPYTYSFDNQQTWIESNSEYKAPGVYTLYVKDSNGCIFAMPNVGLVDSVVPTVTINSNTFTYNCDGTANGTVTVASAQSADYNYTYSIDGGTPSATNTFTRLTPGNHTVSVYSALKTFPTSNELIKEDFGYGSDTPLSPAPAYCFEDQLPQTVCGSNAFIADGEYTVTPKLNYLFGGVWFPITDHTPPTTPIKPQGRFLVANVKAESIFPILYEKKISSINPNEDLKVELYVANLLSSNFTGIAPNLKIAIEDINGTEISSFITNPIAKNQNWNFISGVLKPGANTSARFVIRSFEKSDCGNDVAIDDIKVYQLPAKLCSFSKDTNFTVPSGKAFSATTSSPQPVSCNGLNDGEIPINATNFNTTNGYQYSINNGSTWLNATTSPFTIKGLPSGDYKLKIRYNSTGICEQTLPTVTVINPPKLQTTSKITNPVKCDSNATLEATSTGGTGSYRFELWNQTNTTIIRSAQNSGIFTNVPAGTYTIRGLDAKNCISSASPITVASPAAVTATIDIANSDLCYDSVNKSSLAVTVSSGLFPFSYSLDGGSSQTDNTFKNVGPGNHIIKVTDSNNCFSNTSSITIGGEFKAQAALTKTVDCTSSPDALITVSFEGGATPLRYKIKRGTTIITTTDITIPTTATSFTYTVSEANAGTYSFILIDNNGCSKTTNTITVAPKVPPVIFPLVQENLILCNGDKTASIKVTLDPSKGVSPFTYDVKNTSNATSYGSQLSGLSAGDYTVKVTDSKACSATETITIKEPLKLVLQTDSAPITCSSSGISEDGKVIVEKVTGGTSPYNYYLTGTNSYSVTKLNNDGTNAYSFPISNFGIYGIKVVDKNNCTVQVQNIKIASPPGILLPAPSPIIDCATGGTALIKINATTLTSSGPFYFSIFKGVKPSYPSGTWQAEDAPNSGGATFTGLIRGVNYTFVAYDLTTKCYATSVGEFKIPTNSKLVVENLDPKNISCKGLADGKVSIMLKSPYTTDTAISYQVYDSQSLDPIGSSGTATIKANSNLNIEDFGSLAVGNYFVLIKETSGINAGCNIATNPFSITESLTVLNLPEVTKVKNANCKENGVISIKASGGTGPYMYKVEAKTIVTTTATIPPPPPASTLGQWADSNSFALVSGTYTVFVKDAYGCIKQTETTVDKDAEPVINLSVTNACATEGNFEIKVTQTTAGIAPHYLSVNSAALEETTFPYTLTSKNSGDYSITVQDKNGCTNTQTKTILKPLSVSPKVVQLPSCYINDGKFDVFVTGGSGSFEYKLNSGSFSPLSNFTGLAPQSHFVQVKDLVTNCTSGIIEQKLEKATPITDLKTSEIPVSCKGGNNGIITATIATPATGINDNPVYKYSLNGGTPQESNVFSGLIAGDYTLKVTSARGCEASKNAIKIIEPDAIVVNTPTAVQYNCGSTNSLNFATVTVSTITGGSNNYVQYDFFRNGTLIKSQDSPTLTETDLLGGSYTVNVYDKNGCMGSTTAAVTLNKYIKLEKIKVTIDKAIDCNTGENITVSVEGIPTNPTNLEYSLISKSVPLASAIVNTTGKFQGIAVGDYLILVKNLDTACIIEMGHNVTEPNTFSLKMDTPPTDVSCFGGSNGSVKLSLIDNSLPSRTGAFSYQLKDSSGNSVSVLPSSSLTNSVSITGLKAGVYTFTATLTSAPYCPVSMNFTISQPSQKLELKTTSSPITCVVGNNDGSISASASAGWSSYEYQLQSDVSLPTSWSSSVTEFKGLIAGKYTIKVRDYKGCEVSSDIELKNPSKISFSASANLVMLNCKGDQTATISVTNTLGGYGSDYSYILKQISPKTVTSTSQLANQFANLGVGTYTITANDPWSCIATSQEIVIAEPERVEASLSVQKEQTCTIRTQLKLVSSGGKAPYTYSDNGTTYNSASFVSSNLITVDPGTFQYYVKDANNCKSVVSNSITIAPIVNLTIAIDDTFGYVKCKGDSTAEITATAQGGLGNYSYSLLDELGVVVIKPAQASGVFSGLPAGKYSVKVESVDCIAIKPVIISEPTIKFKSDVTPNPASCSGFTDGSITIVTVGGTGVIKQAISPNFSQLTDSKLFENLGAGTYDILIQDSVGCFEIFTRTILEPLEISASTIVSSIKQEVCFDDKNAEFSITISGGTLPYTVSLDDSGSPITGTPTQTRFDFNGLNGGTHTVYIEDANKCNFEWSVVLNEPVKLNPVALVDYDCGTNTAINKVIVKVQLDPSITNFSLVQYALDGLSNQLSDTFTDVSPGNHFIRVKHNNGCIRDTDIFEIIKIDPLILSIKQGGLNEIIAIAKGGSGNYDFTFNDEFTDSNNSYTYNTTQNYLVKVQDSNGCVATVTEQFSYIDICIPNNFTPNGDGINDTWSPGCISNHKNFVFVIFDRYGREIQSGKFGESWDGKYNGVELPAGDYWYTLKLNNPKDGREFIGHFTLYR